MSKPVQTLHANGDTFVANRVNNDIHLCIRDIHGNHTVIATFHDENCVRLFNQALACAKAASHAAGTMGI